MAPAGVTKQLVDYWSNVTIEDIPDPALAMAKAVILDTLVVGLAGAGSEDVAAVTQATQHASGTNAGGCTIWGTAQSGAPAQAALINGVACHALEFDDFAGCGHSGAVVVPAVAAIADATKADGASVLKAVIAGYDIAARVLAGAGGYRPHNERGWHSTGTCGAFGAAGAAATILKLPAKEYNAALGIVGSYAAGTWAYNAEGASTKRLHTGRSAEAGVVSAYLAQAGLSGPTDILEAPWGGFFSTYCGEDAQPELTIENLGKDFRILRTGVKLYPCCRGIHSLVEPMLTLMHEHDVPFSEIDEIIVHGADRHVRQFSKREIATVLDGQFSLPYALSVIAIDKAAGLDQFVPSRAGDERVQAMMQRVDVIADRHLTAYEEPDLEVRLHSGRVLSAHVDIAKGDYRRPLTADELLNKHESLAVPHLGQGKFNELRSLISGLETLDNFRLVSSLLMRKP